MNGEAVVTIADADVQIATFQNGVNGYNGTQDATIDGEQVFNRFGQDSVVRVDQVKGEGEDPITQVRPQQGLIMFDDLFGASANQIPEGATIFDAFLTVNVTNISPGADVNFFRMLQPWEEVNATWTNPQGSEGFGILNGVTPDGVEATVSPEATVANPGRAGLVEIPLDADTIQAWANGTLDNFGWSIISDSGSLWSFNSSEAFLAGTFRPELTILYTDPVEEDPGVFSLSVDDYKVNESGTATVTVHRIGGSEGAATVDWSLAAGTGDLTDVSGATAGSIVFADGELSKSFNIAINDDIVIEPNETLAISISGAGLEFDRDFATLTIRDNDFDPFSGDLLLNEIWINSPGNDPPYEFVELKGESGVGFGSLYYIAVEGLIGDRTGTAEKVVDIGGYSNGSNGYTILTPDAEDFGFNVPAATTQIDGLGSIGTENVASQNDSTTYLLVYSPFTEITTTSFDYDWDDDGALELPPGATIVDSLGVLVLGAEDQIYGPSTNRAQFAVTDPDVDAVSRFRNNNTRNSGSSWFGGDLEPAGDDYLLYEAAESFGLPVDGAALTPGEANVGSDVESPLVALTSVVGNPDGTLTLTFDGPVSQNNLGDGGFVGPDGSGITISRPDGTADPQVDALPIVSGYFTNTLTLSFTGSGVAGGALPAGSYQLNIVGNGVTGNGRAIDGDNSGSPTGSDAQFSIEVAAGSPDGDYNADGKVDAADYAVWRNNLGQPIALPFEAATPGEVTIEDYQVWRENYGSTGGAAITVENVTMPAPLAGLVASEPGQSSAASSAGAVEESDAADAGEQEESRFANARPQKLSAARRSTRAAARHGLRPESPAARDAALLLLNGEASKRGAGKPSIVDGEFGCEEKEVTDEGDYLSALDGAFEVAGV